MTTPKKKPAPKKAAARKPAAKKRATTYRKNPAPVSTERKMKAGVELFEAFTGHEATHYDRVDLPDMSVCVQIGALDGIAYETTRDGKKQKYFHQFKKAARPVFAVTADGKALVIVGGRFRFTERGIVDEGSAD